MAKIAKKNSQKKKTNKEPSSVGKKVMKNFKIKDLVVKLVRLSEKQIENMTIDSQKSPKVTHTHTIQIKMKSDEYSSVNGVCIVNNGAVQPTFDIGLEIRLDKIIVNACDNIANVQEPKYRTTVKTLTQLINDEWRGCKRAFKENKNIFNIDAIVMAQMKGYSPWPSQIKVINKNGKRANVFFFGTSNTGGVNISEIVPMEMCSELIRLLLLRKISNFSKGVREAELCLAIPIEMSLTKMPDEIEHSSNQ